MEFIIAKMLYLVLITHVVKQVLKKNKKKREYIERKLAGKFI